MKDKKVSEPRPARHLSEGFKRKVIEEYLRTGEPKLHIQKRYGILDMSAIHKWMKKYGYKDIHGKVSYFEVANQMEPAIVAKSKFKAKEQDQVELAKRIKELERQLEDEKLRSEAYRLMIEIAEKELKIPIRKKPNTK
jgi:transposase-like protein